MNKDHLFRVSLKAVIRNEAGDVLVVREKGQKVWGLPGGGMDYGETYVQALARELYEEVGYTGGFTERIIGYDNPKTLSNRESEIWQTRLVFEVITEHNHFSVGSDGEELRFVDTAAVEKEPTSFDHLVYTYCIE